MVLELYIHSKSTIRLIVFILTEASFKRTMAYDCSRAQGFGGIGYKACFTIAGDCLHWELDGDYWL
jgi:hypothetical protein